MLPFAVVLGIVAWVLHRRVLRLWRRGEVLGAVVIDSAHTAIAPRTHLVRCTPTDPGDKRLLQAYLPGNVPRPHQGQPLWLIAPPDPSTRAVTAEWFH